MRKRESDDKRGTGAPGSCGRRELSACGEASGSVARESGPRGEAASGRSPGGRTPRRAGGHRMTLTVGVEETARFAQEAGVCSMRLVIAGPGTPMKHQSHRDSARGRECEGCGQGPGGPTRAGRTAVGPGGPVRSIRKNHAFFSVPVLRTSTTGRTVTFLLKFRVTRISTRPDRN